MKILQLGKFYPPVFGGIQNVMYEFTTGLNEENIHCDVLCSNNQNIYQITDEDGYKIFRTKSYGIYFSTSITPQMIFKLKEIQNEYDIISIHAPDPMAALALFMIKPQGRVVLHWHSDVIKQKFLLKLFDPLQNWLINRADVIIGATKIHIEDSNQAHLMKDKNVILPYPFNSNTLKSCVDINLFSELKENYKNKKIIFSMGRLIYYKGFSYLIEAAKYLNDDYVILIGGEGELEASLKKIIDDNNLTSKVKLIGFIPHKELGTYYKLCDIFCLSSVFRSEMFGIVQLEAMSFGKPIITSKLEKSGVCSVNIHGVTGQCVASNNAIAIADAIISILKNHYTYKTYSENCIYRVDEVFNKKKVINKLINIYKKLLI
jgi:rhamnosyl/mannosyltransferase